jgi:cob(I)alamin adenosyltransferase
MSESIKALQSKNYDLVVLDEALSAVESELLTEADILEIIKAKPAAVHLCMTGHKRFKKIIAAADLVTEMKMIKHPYYEGILAQRGIDY